MHTPIRLAVALLAAATATAASAQAPATPGAAPADTAANPAPAAGGDAALVQRGKRLYLRCVACHDTAPTGLPKTGPHLQGIVGRRAGAVEGYAYSAAMKGQSQPWDAARLDAWLAQPSAVVPATSMVFIGMPDAAERQALLAYLRTLN